VLADAFAANRYDVAVFNKGQDAISHLAMNDCDLVVVDLGLPDISGTHISRWIKEHRPQTYFIMATGWAERLTQKDYEEGRIDAVFKKPYTAAEIVNHANKFLPADNTVNVNEEVLA
jgi:DNA-binding response OmpR family regulator